MPKVTVNGQTTYVKKITVGIPVRSINEAASGVISGSGRVAGSILINASDTNLFSTGELQASHGLVKVFDSAGNNIVLSLDSSELKSIIDSNYVALVSSAPFVDSAYVEANSLDSERGLNLLRADLQDFPRSIIPQVDSNFDLGSPTKKWRRLFLSGNTIVLGGLTLNDAGGTFAIKDSSGTVSPIDISGNTTTDLAEGNNLYYTRARFDSALGDSTSRQTVRGYVSGGHGIVYSTSTGNISIDSSEVRGIFAAGGDLSYDSNTGTFSIDVEQVYTQSNFESDLSLSLNATNGIVYDSSNHKLSLINTGVDSATYGTSTRIPVLTINSQGRVDSAGSVLVAGVTGVAFDSSNETLTVSTADGNTFTAEINRFNNARFDSAVATNISGSSSNFTAAHTAQLSADSALIGNMTITGDLTVSGTQTTINTQTVKVHDPIIHLADSNEVSDIVDLGFVGKYYRDGQQRHTGLVRDASNEQYYLFKDVVDSSLDSSLTINRSATDFTKADLNVGNLLADSATLTNLDATGTVIAGTLAVTGVLSRPVTVDSGTYGSATLIPQITVDTSGFIDSIGEVLVAGVTGFALDSATGVLSISTADGGTFSAIIDSNYLAEKVKNLEGDITITTNDDGAGVGPSIILQRDTASPADSDLLGQIIFRGKDDGGSNQEYAKIRGVIHDASAGVEDGAIETFIFDSGAYDIATRLSKSSFELLSNIPLKANSVVIDGELVDSSFVSKRAKEITSSEFKVISTSDSSLFGPKITLDRNNSSPSDSDAIGIIEFRGRNSVDSEIKYGAIEAFLADPSADSEDGEIQFHITQSGFDRPKLIINRQGVLLDKQERLIFQDDSHQQIIAPANYTSGHTLTLPDSTGTLFTVDHLFKLIDSSFINARTDVSIPTLTFKDRDSNEFSLVVRNNILFTGGVVDLASTVTLLNEDSAEILITL